MPYGTYRAPGGNNCYWETLRSFDGGLNSIIANDVMTKNPVVTIPSSAKGFDSSDCGTWTKIG